MLNAFAFVFITTLIMTFSLGSINYFGIHRAFELMYRGVLENSMDYFIYSDENVYYFVPETLERNVLDYFERNISRYTHEYDVSFYYFNAENDSYCSSYCRSVKISLKADLNLLFHYEKARSFSILRGYKNG